MSELKPKFKVGDMVRILDGRKHRDMPHSIWTISDEGCMNDTIGKVAVIREVQTEEPDHDYITYRLEGYCYHYNEFDLELVESESNAPIPNPTSFYFETNKTERINKRTNTRIPQIKTVVYLNGATGTAVCDEVDYVERDGILNAIANMNCNGNFDKVYNRLLKQIKAEDKIERTCLYCGLIYNSKDEALTCEEKHLQNKFKRFERYKLRGEALRRIKQMEDERTINDYMTKILIKRHEELNDTEN